jgi:hypothetical protein
MRHHRQDPLGSIQPWIEAGQILGTRLSARKRIARLWQIPALVVIAGSGDDRSPLGGFDRRCRCILEIEGFATASFGSGLGTKSAYSMFAGYRVGDLRSPGFGGNL